MSIETTVLVENISSVTSELVFSSPKKGSGHHLQDGLHTYIYQVEDFDGVIKLQATLELYPGESDWFDIGSTMFFSAGDTLAQSGNFLGNFVWIRAGYQVISGTISQIRFNY
jgi:hypothetical protein